MDKTANEISSAPKRKSSEIEIKEEAPKRKSSEIEIKEESPKRKSSEIEIKEEEVDCKMLPSFFNECHPITNIDDIEEVLEEPPRWIERVKPLIPRSPTVIQNIISDCHSDSNHFLPRNRLDRRTVPKTLLCHDYKGGYQADRYLHYSHEEILGNGYPFYNWAQIDIFVYFSHHFITIPPLCWINAAHTNGVKVLGTIITEFETGSNLCKEKIFKNMFMMKSFAHSLARLTRIFGFDGWLLNIENNVENIEILKKFVIYFTNLIHADNPENLIIWYDSVTENGKLDWQNQLNEKNRFFFDACDAIFLNYSWSEKELISTVEAAKHRNLDIFVGIDVFGRNMFGGGKFNTYKAAEIVTRYNLSMAIFAPGWTHETLDRTDTFFEQFLDRDSAFWSSLWPYLYTHPINSFFSTNFYIGLDKSCYNIFNQQQQLSKFLHPGEITVVPDYETIPTLNNKCGCIQAVTIGSKNSCLITREYLRKNIEYVHHLFVCDIQISNNTVVYYLTKSTGQAAVALTVTLLTCGLTGSFKKIKLLGLKKEYTVNNSSVMEVNPSEAVDIEDNIKNMYYKMVENEQWNVTVFIFNTPICNILEVGGTIEGGNSIYLGAFGIENADGHFLKSF